MKTTLTRAALLSLLLVGPAAAQHADHDHDAPGPNGGRRAEAGKWHAEMVTKGDTVAIYVSDGSFKPVAPAGFKGTAILVVGGKSFRIALAPEGERLSGKAEAELGANPKGAVRLEGPGGASATAKFD